MPDITRDIGQVNSNNYIRPGVQQPSPLSLAAQLGGIGMEADKMYATQQLEDQLDALRTQYETSNPHAVATQDATAAAPQLSATDQAQVNDVKSQLAANQAAVAQGTMSTDEFRIRGERLLRLAISKRPGLAQDFRQAAQEHLGTDVVGATVEINSRWENQMQEAMMRGAEMKMNAAMEAQKEQVKLQREHLALVGVDTGNMTNDQVMAEYPKHIDAITQKLQLDANSAIMKARAGITTDSNTINRPTAMAAWSQQVGQNMQEVYSNYNKIYSAYQAGRIAPGAMPSILTQASTDVQGRIQSLRAAMSNGDIDPQLGEKQLDGLTQLSTQLADVASGKLDNTQLKQRLDNMDLYIKNIYMDDKKVAAFHAASDLFGPQVLAPLIGPGGTLNAPAMLALGNILTNKADPAETAQNAGSITSAVIGSTLDRGGAASNPTLVPHMAKVIADTGAQFGVMDQKDMKVDQLTGPNGFLTILNAHREALAKALPDDQKDNVIGSVSMAALSLFHAMASSMYQQAPQLRGKLDWHLDPTTGDIIRPKPGVTLTTADQRVINNYNQRYQGKYIIQTIQSLGGYSAQDAVNKMYNSEPAYQQSQVQARSRPKQQLSNQNAWWLNGTWGGQ